MKLKIDEKQFLAAVDHEGDHEVGAGKFPDDKRANSTFANSENASNDSECTDCRGTGVTLQTERRCHCQPLPPNEIDQAMQELNRQHDVYAAAREEYRKKIAEQADRIEQLEMALWEIAASDYATWGSRNIARAALGEKP